MTVLTHNLEIKLTFILNNVSDNIIVLLFKYIYII